MENLNIEESLESLGINNYKYKYEPISSSRRALYESSVQSNKILSFINENKSLLLRLFILFSFSLGFYLGLESLDYAYINTDNNEKPIHSTSMSSLSFTSNNKHDGKRTIIELLGELSRQRSIQEKVLKQTFGEKYYGAIFNDPFVMEKLFQMEPLSKERLLRRMMIKILSAQLPNNPLHSDISTEENADLDPNHMESSDTTANRNPNDVKNSDATTTTFIWATGGDSAAAGHGNLYQQSYTQIMSETVEGAFKSLGIQFQGRNYAMGGSTSAPELAFCMEAIYGSDLDVLVWDFSTTEEAYMHWDVGKQQEKDRNTIAASELNYKASLWGHRAGIHPTKPVLFMMDNGRRSSRWKSFSNLVKRGMGAVLMDSAELVDLIQTFPMTKTSNPSKHDIESRENLPPILQYLRCESDSIEGSVPCDDPQNYLYCVDERSEACKEFKYDTQEVCTDARYQRAYNPGWKFHYIKGKLLGYFLLDMLSEALSGIEALLSTKIGSSSSKKLLNDLDYDPEKIGSILEFLQSKEEEDKIEFHESRPDSQELKGRVKEVDANILYRSHAMCHTALLPSQSRFDGILTEKRNSNVDNFDLGTNKVFLKPVDDGKVPLVWDPNDRQKCRALEIDHKDFFFVRTDDEWVSATIPNSFEKELYGRWAEKISKREGLLMVCLRACPLYHCPEEATGFDSLTRGVLSMRIDNRPVIGARALEECHFMEGKDGIRWGVEKDEYVIRFKIEPKTGKWMKITSIILF